MGVYAKDTESLEEVLCIVEHPWKSFKAHKPFARIGLAAFLVFYLPLGLIAAFLFEIFIHLPYKLLFGPRRWCLATTDPGFWYDYVYASPRRKILMVHLQDEIMAAGLDGTIESACEKGARAQRTSAWTKMTVTWMWTNSIYVPPLAIPPRALWANDSLGLSQQDGIPQNQLGQRLPRVRHFTSIDEDFWVHTLSLVRRPASIAESPGKVVLARRFRLKHLLTSSIQSRLSSYPSHMRSVPGTTTSIDLRSSSSHSGHSSSSSPSLTKGSSTSPLQSRLSAGCDLNTEFTNEPVATEVLSPRHHSIRQLPKALLVHWATPRTPQLTVTPPSPMS